MGVAVEDRASLRVQYYDDIVSVAPGSKLVTVPFDVYSSAVDCLTAIPDTLESLTLSTSSNAHENREGAHPAIENRGGAHRALRGATGRTAMNGTGLV